jgi:signal transduction histidine kinase
MKQSNHAEAKTADAAVNYAEVQLSMQAMFLARQVRHSPYSVLLVVSCIVYGIFPYASACLVLTWFAAVAFCLVLRSQYAKRVLIQNSAPTVIPAKQVMRNLTYFAFANGMAVGISAPLFFHGLPDVSRAMVALVLVGLSAGGIATSAAYPPVFRAYIFPALLPLAVSWFFMGGIDHVLIGLLVLLFITILLKFVEENYKLLKESFSIRFEREELVQKLENKQKQLLLAKEQAEEAGHAKARVLAAASHDLRQPLHALSLYSAVLSQHPNPQTLDSVAQQIDLSVRALSALLNALLDISKLDAGVYQIEPYAFNVEEVLERICFEFQPLARKKGLMLYLHTKPVQAFSDPVVFERIARNLIDNAIKYTEHGAVIISTKVETDSINVSVEDSGKGIPHDELVRVFEEFYQLDNPGRDREQGLGLGLSIVQRLAQLIGSKVTLASVFGEGSCFSWHIPLQRRATASPPSVRIDDGAGFSRSVHAPENIDFGNFEDDAANESKDEMLMMSAKFHILVIEDEAAIRHGMTLLLQTWGMQAFAVATQAEAERILARQQLQKPIDLVIADLRLQDGVHGLAVVNALRQRWHDLPVILISGETDPGKLKDVAASGFPLMNKPILPEMLRKNIAQMLEQS